MIKVSIIVPIYNVEKFLIRCLESIQKQNLEDIQIILVNDGSTDNSLHICKEYEKKDKRIEVVDKPNGGVSSARNAGIQVAKGEYIGFVDSDDFLDKDMYRSMYAQAKEDESDICMCNYVIEDNNLLIPQTLKLEKKLLKNKEIFDDIILNMIASPNLDSGSTSIMGSVCRLIIKKELILKYNLKFQKDIILSEDLIFCIEALLKSRKVSINEGIYYHYVCNADSATESYNKNFFNIQLNVYKAIESLLKESDTYKFAEQRMNNRYIYICIWSTINEISNKNTKSATEKIREIKRFCKEDKLKMSLKKIDKKEYMLRSKLALMAIEHEAGIYLYIYYNMIKKFKNRKNIRGEDLKKFDYK